MGGGTGRVTRRTFAHTCSWSRKSTLGRRFLCPLASGSTCDVILPDDASHSCVSGTSCRRSCLCACRFRGCFGCAFLCRSWFRRLTVALELCCTAARLDRRIAAHPQCGGAVQGRLKAATTSHHGGPSVSLWRGRQLILLVPYRYCTIYTRLPVYSMNVL